MMKQTFFTAISGFALLVILMAGCQKEDGLSPIQDNRQITVRSHDCDDPFTCWDVNDQDKYADSSTITNNTGSQTRVFKFKYYNTLSNFHVDWSYLASNNAARYLKITVTGNGVDDASFSTPIVQSVGSGSHDFTLEAGWDLCYDANWVAEIWEPVAPAGPTNDVLIASTMGSYDLVDECTCDDGRQNQGETGVDCGGPCAPCVTGCDESLTATVNCTSDEDGCNRHVTFTYEAGADHSNIVIQGGLTAFTTICNVSSTGGNVTQNTTHNSAGGPSNVTRWEASGVEECDVVTVTIDWTSTNANANITGTWTVKDGNGIELASLSPLTCPQ